MTLISRLQQNQLKNRRLQFVRTHQEAFDVEPTFILSLFEEAVQRIEGTCGVEAICTVEQDQLFPVEFQVCNDEGKTWPNSLAYAVKFLDNVESQVGVRLNRNLLEQFVAIHMGSHKIENNTIGIDLRPKYEDSCIKVYLHLGLKEEPEDLVETALKLDGGSYSPEVIQVLLKSTIVIGFNMFLNGYSDVELWACSAGEQYENPEFNRGKYLKYYIQNKFSQKVISQFKEVFLLLVVFSKNKTEPLLMFQYEKLKNVRKNFLFNGLGDRIYNFCQNQDCISYVTVGTTEQELEKARLKKFVFSYNKRDECQPKLALKKHDNS